ncbi:hypothetical protein Gasu2_36250 [Galdieria sulphuraria]|uniref:DNA-directed RNA polymerase III subunit n=1 Tax=Galdieria sulphuraria TaxID=130081 RepID=M2WTB5_GALSU|nr:uncharacterized protein Gasu_52530 [Galdieria sulphuraria]EME27150.1 hypothetical protein Gasu_52530 [Galdieria sulphuraria]GJD09368.1 hypothetical protein Gasu2_36250 [Galdieria sulphuraria]|eukprot:XP_005703670.1 hypothetical protein Gasu_52530 [Galdieria sulphuraria]
MNRGRRRRSFRRTASPIRRTIQELDQQRVATDKGFQGSELFPHIVEDKFPKAIRPKGTETSPQSEIYTVQLFRNLRKALLNSPLYSDSFQQKLYRHQVYTYSDLILHTTEKTKPQLFEDPTWLRTKLLPNFLLPNQKNNTTITRSKRKRLLSSTHILETLPQDTEVKETQPASENTREDFFSEEEQDSEFEEEDDDYAQGEVFDDDDEYETAEQSDSEPVL